MHEMRTLPQSSLPGPLTPLVGREQEIAAVCALLWRPEVRLVTLTGTGGVGKTRLALEVAVAASPAFADGICFVTLAPLIDPRLVLSTIAQALGVREQGSRPLLESLHDHLREQQVLLLLDNFEQVVSAAPVVAELLVAAPRLHVLVTSRTSLHLSGEHEFVVPPLALPDLRNLPPPDRLIQYGAIRLFVERAQAVNSTFVMTGENAHAIAAVCQQVDGLPLAIELAAGRSKLFSPQALLPRLANRLKLLVGGAQDLPLRQQTLRGTIAWSYDLLSQDEKALFRQLAVFVGGCTLEAAEAVCAAQGDLLIDVLEAVAALVDKSLLRQEAQADGQPRLLMLETIREYGQACLASSGEAEATRQAHAEYYLALAEEAEPRLISAEQLQWLERLEQEHDNLRAALSWLLEKEQIELALRLGGALGTFWLWHAHCREGLQWLEQALARSREVLAPVRAKALYHAAAMAYYGGDHRRAAELMGEGLKVYRKLGDKQGIAICLNALGHNALTHGDYTALRALYEESLPLLEEVGDTWHLAEALYLSAYGCYAQGDYARARALGEESLALCREVGERWGMADILQTLGLFAFTQGDYATARTCYEESLTISRPVGEKWVAALCLVGLGEVVAVEGKPVRAACLWGAAETLRAELGVFIPHAEQVSYERSMSTVRAQLSEDVFRSAWTKGRTMPLEQAIAEALATQDEPPAGTKFQQMNEEEASSVVPPGTPSSQPSKALSPRRALKQHFGGLTSREREVACLVAQGKSNRAIADELVVGISTVEAHITHIFTKLGFSSRAQIAAWAVDKGLAKALQDMEVKRQKP